MKLKRYEYFKKLNEGVLQKDLDRMISIKKKSGGDLEKMTKYVQNMAKAIKDKHKALQRGKAADEILKNKSLGNIFYDRAKELGLEFNVNVIRSRKGMEKFGLDDPKLGSKLPDTYKDNSHRKGKYFKSVLPIGSVNIQSGDSKHFNIYDTWDNSTAEVWKDGKGKLKLIFTSGDKPLHNIGEKEEFRNYNNGNRFGEGENWTMVEWVKIKDLKELLRVFNKKSFTGYVYK